MRETEERPRKEGPEMSDAKEESKTRNLGPVDVLIDVILSAPSREGRRSSTAVSN